MLLDAGCGTILQDLSFVTSFDVTQYQEQTTKIPIHSPLVLVKLLVKSVAWNELDFLL